MFIFILENLPLVGTYGPLLYSPSSINTLGDVRTSASCLLAKVLSSIFFRLLLVSSMANLKFMFACLFLVVLIFFQEIQSTEGRQLNSGMKKGSSELKTHVKITKFAEHNANESLPTKPPTQVVAKSQPPPSGHVEAFRPTSPGHSPGIGHFLQN